MRNAEPRRKIHRGIQLGIVFLALQGVAFVWAKFVPTRYFCWAPYDTHTFYTISVRHLGRELNEGEIYFRYHLPARGHDPRSPYHVINALEQYERTYGAGEAFEINLTYTVNGHPPLTWRFPAKQ
jgi:hypothetical protein